MARLMIILLMISASCSREASAFCSPTWLALINGFVAVAQAPRSRRSAGTLSHREFSVSELDWFSRNTYNISLKYCGDLRPDSLARLLRCCIQVSRTRHRWNDIYLYGLVC